MAFGLIATAAKSQAAPQAVEIVLPSKLVAGQQATLSALDASGHLVPRTSISFSDGTQTETDVYGFAHMTAPASPGALIARLTLHPEVKACTVVLPPPASSTIAISLHPTLVSLHDFFEIRGTGFSADARGNQVTFDDKPAAVLASSPTSLVILLAPNSVSGTAKLNVSANGAQKGVGLTAVAVEFALQAQQVVPGMKTKLIVRIRGTDKPQQLEIENLTPDVLAFAHDAKVQVHTRGGANNATSVEVRALRAGDFSFRAKFVYSGYGVADAPVAYTYLRAAQNIASPEWQHRLDPIATELERAKPNVSQAYDRLNKLLPDAPKGDVATFMTASRDALLGH